MLEAAQTSLPETRETANAGNYRDISVDTTEITFRAENEVDQLSYETNLEERLTEVLLYVPPTNNGDFSQLFNGRSISTLLHSPVVTPIDISTQTLVATYRDHIDNEEEYEAIVRVLERLLNRRLDNQRVAFTPEQEYLISTTAIARLIERVNRGRLEEQRASSVNGAKYKVLNDLIMHITSASSRGGYAAQRIVLTPRQEKKMAIATLTTRIAKGNERRMTNQDWQSPVELRRSDLITLQEKIDALIGNTCMLDQRFELSAQKAFSDYMRATAKQIGRMEAYRLDAQDADNPDDIRERRFETELEPVLQRMSARLDNQRVVFRKAARSSSI